MEETQTILLIVIGLVLCSINDNIKKNNKK